jgi:putative transposase
VKKTIISSDNKGMDEKCYPSDLTDGQWQLIASLLPKAKSGGRPRTVDLRRIVDGILYMARGGCSWRMLPHDYGPWSTVYDYFRKYRRDGTWKQIHDSLHIQVRLKDGRDPNPSAAIIDSQSVKTAEKGGIADMMLARRFRVENAISLLIHWVY